MSTLQDTFTAIYNINRDAIEKDDINLWKSKISVSGLGSEVENNAYIIEELPRLFKKYNIKSVLDLPCGDFNWMKNIDLDSINYTGADIVEELIEDNKGKFPNYNFTTLNLAKDDLPTCDLLLVRDCFIHLSNRTVFECINNIRKSQVKYLLTTSFIKNENTDIADGEWRRINLLLKPFSFTPILMINELSNEPRAEDKFLALFRVEDL